MQPPIFNSIPILSKTPHHPTIEYGFNPNLLINPFVVENLSSIVSTALETKTSINNAALCTGLSSLGEFKGFSTLLPDINTDFQLLKFPITPECQAVASIFPLLSKTKLPNTVIPALNTPMYFAHFNPIPWSPDLLSLCQETKKGESSFQKQEVFIDNKLVSPHKLHDVSAVKKLKKTRKRHRCPALLSFIKEWIKQGFYFSSFSKHMKEVYLFNYQPKDNETYQEHELCKRVYLTSLDGNKHRFHYSLIRPNGTLIPQRSYALSSLKRIFAYVDKNIKE